MLIRRKGFSLHFLLNWPMVIRIKHWTGLAPAEPVPRYRTGGDISLDFRAARLSPTYTSVQLDGVGRSLVLIATEVGWGNCEERPKSAGGSHRWQHRMAEGLMESSGQTARLSNSKEKLRALRHTARPSGIRGVKDHQRCIHPLGGWMKGTQSGTSPASTSQSSERQRWLATEGC